MAFASFRAVVVLAAFGVTDPLREKVNFGISFIGAARASSEYGQ